MSFAVNLNQSGIGPTVTRAAPRHFGGWAFQRIATLDLRESAGVLAEVASRSPLVRQAVFVGLSCFHPENRFCGDVEFPSGTRRLDNPLGRARGCDPPLPN